MSSVLELPRANFDQSYPPEPKFSEEGIPDSTRKVFVITGGYTGIGKKTAHVVLEHNAKVYIVCRSEERANAAIADLIKVTGQGNIHFLSLDLASFASVRNAAEEFKRCDIQIQIQGLLEAAAFGVLGVRDEYAQNGCTRKFAVIFIGLDARDDTDGRNGFGFTKSQTANSQQRA